MTRLRVVAVGELPLISGFALAGLESNVADSSADAIAQLAETLKRPDVGIVLAQRAVIDALPDAVRRRAARQSVPIVLGLPSPDREEAAHEAESPILDLLQRAIGYRVRLQ